MATYIGTPYFRCIFCQVNFYLREIHDPETDDILGKRMVDPRNGLAFYVRDRCPHCGAKMEGFQPIAEF